MVTLQTPTNDPGAPGDLRMVQDFLNTPRSEPTQAELAMADAIRADGDLGVPQATLAAQHGVSRQLVSAILRRKRLVARPASLGTPEASRFSLVGLGLMDASSGPLAETEYLRVLEVHRLLLALALANNTGQLSAETVQGLNALADSAPVRVQFDAEGRSVLQPSACGAGEAIARLLAIVHDSMRDGTWYRLKVCPADRCEAAFYDTSRNRSATWCSMAICGNRAKVSSYQRRRRSTRPG